MIVSLPAYVFDNRLQICSLYQIIFTHLQQKLTKSKATAFLGVLCLSQIILILNS